jgi:hypothetical protein
MAANLMAIAMQPDDLVGIYSGPEAGPLTNQAAGDVEGCPPARIGAPTVAALFGTSSKVKLTIAGKRCGTN